MPARRELTIRIAVYALLALIAAAGVTGVLGSWLGIEDAPTAALTILLLAAVLWISEAVPLFVTSFVIAFLNVVCLAPLLRSQGADIADQVFLSPFFSNIILLFLGGFVLSAALRKYMIDERIARWVIDRTGGHPDRVLFGVMAATAFLSMWMSNTATTAMMLSLAVALLKRVREDDGYRKALVLGIPFAANLGGLGTPIGTPPNAIAMRYMEEAGLSAPGFGMWLALSLPVLLVGLLFTWWLLKRWFPTNVERVELEDRASFRWNVRSRSVVVVSVLTALGWLTSDLHHLSTGSIALLPVLAFFGTRTLDIRDFRNLSWDVLFIVGGGLSLGVAVDRSGLGAWFVSLVPGEDVGTITLLVALAVAAAVMTSIMSNTATANLLVPVVVGLTDVEVTPLLMAVAYACSVSMALPVSTPPNAMVFSSGMLQSRDLIRPGLVVSVVSLGLTLTVGYWWWGLLGAY